MAATKNAEAKLTFAFADDTTRDLRLGPLDPDKITIDELRTAAKAFKPADVAGIYVSDAGSNCTAVSGLTVFETSESEINLN